MLVDAEHCFDPYYSKALGVDVESLIVCQPDNGEMALESRFLSLSDRLLTFSRWCLAFVPGFPDDFKMHRFEILQLCSDL